MRKSMQWLIALLGLILTACSQVTAFIPVGDEPVYLEPEEWEGLWAHIPFLLSDDEQRGIDQAATVALTSVRVLDAGGGILELCDQYGSHRVTRVVIRGHKSGDKVAFFVSRFSGDSWGYEWGKVSGLSSPLIIWWPKWEEFDEMVKSGILTGQKVEIGESSELLLAPMTTEQLDVLSRDEGGRLFDYQFEGLLEFDTVWMRISTVPANCGDSCPTMSEQE